MRGAVLVAIAAAIGNLLQGWDNATIAGSVLYIKREFDLQSQPNIEGLIVAMSLIGATVITTFSGPVSDWLGRRPMLIISSVLYFVSGLVMLWAPNVYVLLLARLLDGFGVGWRLMLGVLSIPSTIYFVVAVFYLPESPRWLVSKGKMKEAKRFLQKIRGRPDVSGEMALLIEGLDVGGETSIEEYIIGPDNELADNHEHAVQKDRIKLYGAEEGQSWIAKPTTGQSTLGLFSRQGSLANRSMLMDPMVTLFGSVHEKLPEMGSMKSILVSNFGSMLSVAENHGKNEHWDEESLQRDAADNAFDASGAESDDNLRSPLLSRHDTNTEKENHGEQASGIGMVVVGNWRIERMKNIRVILKEYTYTRRVGLFEAWFAALVSQSVLRADDILSHHPVEAATDITPETAAKRPSWMDLFEPGVKHALVVGVGIQIPQQFSGINGVLYYTPQILEQAGVGVLLSNLGIGSDSESFLISALTTLLMLPSIGVAMRLMDVAGRRWLLLSTLPVLLATLILLILGNIIKLGTVVHAVISTVSVIIYFCCFVMGFGPIPNILCAEIFPTRVRGLCIAICALTFWIGDIIVTYSLPLMLNSVGLAGAFSMYAVVCAVAWFFVFFKVPETKGMPLEVITEFFVVGAKHNANN
ncbi:hypothetical protein OROHE_014411 [Orobanche hederae]